MFVGVSMLCLYEPAFVYCGHAVGVCVYVYVLCGYYCVHALSLFMCVFLCVLYVCAYKLHSKIPFIQSHLLGFINRRRQHGLH